MPIQNRVDAWGRMHAVAAHGAFMGNRGHLHDESRKLVRRFQHKRWVTCALSFEGRKREIWGPRTYSELFFLDEATAFSAGHRPCAECRRARYNEFKAAWLAANAHLVLGSRGAIDEIDALIHQERVDPGGKKSYTAAASSLPNGTVVVHLGVPRVVLGGRLLQWSFDGYSDPMPIEGVMEVAVLTPKSVAAAFAQGFVPQIHESASAL